MTKIQFKPRRRTSKNLTVGDVHAPTALGNEVRKPKARDFLSTIADFRGGAKVIQMPTLETAPVGKKDGLTTVYFMRHGATKFNNQTDMSQDRVRSWNDVPLTDEGRDDARKAGKKLDKYGIKFIVSSSLGRAKETARIVKKEIGDKDIKVINTPKMLPWNLGKFTGQTTDEAHDGIKHYIENPDEEVPEGESFNEFRKRAFAGMAWALKQAGGKPMLAISHHRNERLWATSGDPPRPDAKIDAEKFLKPGEDPGDVTTFEFDQRQLGGKIGKAGPEDEPRDEKGKWTSGAEQAATPTGPKGQRRYWLYDADYNLLGTYERLNVAMAHGMAQSKASGERVTLHDSVGDRETGTTAFEPGFKREPEWNTDKSGNLKWRDTSKDFIKVWDSNADLPDSVKGSLPDEAQTVFRRVANDRIKAGHSDVSAIKQAWTAVKNGWRKEGDQWVRKIWLGSDGMHEFIEHELFKIKGGEFPYAGDTEGMNVSLHLTPINATDARSPFPYNQYFFANLRDDQKERLLAALTDQDSLPVKRVRLADLSAIQDKIDPEKVQQMVDSPPEKLPVVVRSAPGRYNIADGHHRMTAHLLSGDKTVMARFMDIAPELDGVVADGNVGSQKEQKRFWHFLAKVNPFRKVGPEDEARDDKGRWTSGGGQSGLDQHVGNLRAAGLNDQGKFDHAFDRLSNDRGMSNEDLKGVIRRYDDGGIPQGKTRGDHLKQIRQAWVRASRFENKLKRDSQDDWSSDFVVSKVDQDQQKIFGWASVTMIGDEVVVDKQEDIIPDDELEKAAHDYCLYHRVQGDMHERMGVGRLIESALFNQERWDLGFRHIDPDTGLRKFGWFVGFRVDDPGVWKRIKDGELPEFSIGGKATREAA